MFFSRLATSIIFNSNIFSVTYIHALTIFENFLHLKDITLTLAAQLKNAVPQGLAGAPKNSLTW